MIKRFIEYLAVCAVELSLEYGTLIFIVLLLAGYDWTTPLVCYSGIFACANTFEHLTNWYISSRYRPGIDDPRRTAERMMRLSFSKFFVDEKSRQMVLEQLTRALDAIKERTPMSERIKILVYETYLSVLGNAIDFSIYILMFFLLCGMTWRDIPVQVAILATAIKAWDFLVDKYFILTYIPGEDSPEETAHRWMDTLITNHFLLEKDRVEIYEQAVKDLKHRP